MEKELINKVVQEIKKTQTSKGLQPNERSRARYREKVFEVCPGFKVDENNKEILNELFSYAHGVGKLDPNKGIWLYGEVGTGKSTLIKILAEYQRTMWKGFKCVNCASLAAMFSSYGIESLNESTWNEGYMGSNPVERAFDELGRETIPAKYYGNELNVMQHIIQIRYDLKVKTHITTNITPEAIIPLYGEHIYDRAVEMFNFIEMKGESKRK